MLATTISFIVFSSLSFAESTASNAKPLSPTMAIGYNPLAPFVFQLVDNEIRKEANPVGFGATDLNVRLHRLFNDKIGMTLQLEYTQTTFFTRATHVGIRGGPRFSLRETGLSGWTASPFLILGRNVMSAGTYGLASWTTIGCGGELGHSWLLGPLLLELGVGGYLASNVGFVSYAEALDSLDAPDQALGIKPLLTMGVGYAF